MAARKLCGVHSASCGVTLRALSTMRVKRSGVMVAGRAFLIGAEVGHHLLDQVLHGLLGLAHSVALSLFLRDCLHGILLLLSGFDRLKIKSAACGGLVERRQVQLRVCGL